MKFSKAPAWTKDDGTECATNYIWLQSDRPAADYDGAEYSRYLYGMGQDNNHVPLHASALSVQQPFNKLGDGPKRRASEAAPSSEERRDINEDKGLVEMDKSHIVQFATCDIPPITIQDGELV